MKKRLVLVLTLILGILSGCATGGDAAADENTTTIGLSMFTQEFPFYVEMQEAFEEACAEKGYKLTSTNAGMDISTQIDGCMDLIAKGVDALAITSWYGDTLSDVFVAAEEAGIPVFLISTNTAPDDASFVTKVGTIDKDTTYLAGLWTGEYYADQGINELDAVVFMAADQVHNERRDGYLYGSGNNLPYTENLDFLSGLHDLRTLHLSPDGLTDFSGLANCTQLRELYLPVPMDSQDLQVLSGMTELQTLQFEAEGDVDLSPLAGLENLQEVTITNSDAITNWAPLDHVRVVNRY